jgi:antiphage defense system Thoeris ThsB-like protein
MAQNRVYISFDYDHDEDLKTLLVGQSKNEDSPFEIADWSIKEPITGDWKKKARERMRAVDKVAVICGLYTHTATGVAAEVSIAQEEEISYFLLAGRAEGTNRKPTTANVSNELYKWTWPNLKILLG